MTDVIIVLFVCLIYRNSHKFISGLPGKRQNIHIMNDMGPLTIQFSMGMS